MKKSTTILLIIFTVIIITASTFVLTKNQQKKQEKEEVANNIIGFWEVFQVQQRTTTNTGEIQGSILNTTSKELFGEEKIIEFTSDNKLCDYYFINSVYTTQGNKCLDYSYVDGRILITEKDSSGSNYIVFEAGIIESTDEKLKIRFKKIDQPANIIIPEYR